MFGRILRSYVEWVTLHSKGVIAAVLLSTALLATSIKGIYIENERKGELPADDPIVRLDDEILELFGGGRYTMIGVEPAEGDVFQPWVLERIRTITEAVGAIPGIDPDKVLSITAPKVKSIEAGQADEIVVRSLIDQIPSTPAEVEELREYLLGQKLLIGYLIAPEGKAASIVADIDESGGDPDLRDAVLSRRIQEAVAPFRDEKLRIYVGGLPVFIATMDGYTKHMLKLFPLAVLVIGLVHFEAFRTLQAMFLPLVTALLSVTWAMGLFCHLGVPMDGWNALSPFLILAVAAGHAVQILKRYYEEFRRLGDNRAAVVESTVRVGSVMITAGLIAATGLLTLTLFPIRSIQLFGFLSASGIVSALIIEMSFIPACRTLLPAPQMQEVLKEKHGGLLESALNKLARTVRARPWLSLAVGAAVVAGTIFSALRIQVENSFREALPQDSRSLMEYEALNTLFGGTITLNILVEGREPDALYDPALLRAMEGMQADLESVPGVGRANSIVDYVKQMNVAFHGGDERFRRVPESRELVAQYFLLYSGDPDDFEMLVDSQYRRAVIRAFATKDRAKFCEEIFQRARSYAKDHFPAEVRVRVAGGGLAVSKTVNDVVMREKIRNAAVIASIIFLVSSLVLKSFVGGALVLTPSLLAAMVNLGLMGLTGTWLNLATASITSLTVSIGADYSIYFIFRFREEYRRVGDIRAATLETMLTSGKAIFFVASAIAAGALVMAVSPLSYHRQLGGFVATSMFISSLAAVTIVPSLIILFRPRFLQRQERHPEEVRDVSRFGT
ncbi:MAG: MMPL family transporter [bacterium]